MTMPLSFSSVPLLFSIPLDQLCIEDFPEVPSLWPKPCGNSAEKKGHKKSKQLVQSQQCIPAPKSTDLFSFEELERKEADQHFRKTLLQLYPWSISDSKQAPEVSGLLQITQEPVLETYLVFLDRLAPKQSCMEKYLRWSLQDFSQNFCLPARDITENKLSQPTSQNESSKKCSDPSFSSLVGARLTFWCLDLC